MKILVLGASGLLGRAVFSELRSSRRPLTVRGTVRTEAKIPYLEADPGELLSPVSGPAAVRTAILSFSPDVVLNCIGAVKQATEIPTSALIEANALIPHVAAEAAVSIDAYFVQISTDCVFSGRVGYRSEIDEPDPVDVYGRSKVLGEVARRSALTIRTSFVGHEISLDGKPRGLLDWFLSSLAPCDGWINAYWNGLTAGELAKVIAGPVLEQRPVGICHVAGETISKFFLLRTIADIYDHPRMILPSAEPILDRTLDGSRFQRATGYKAPSIRYLLEREVLLARSRLLSAQAENER